MELSTYQLRRALAAGACSTATILVACGSGGNGDSASVQPLSLAERCPTLAGTTLDATTTISTASLISGSFTPPGSTTALTGVPEVCRVVGVAKPTADSNINFEVWLPTSTWNKKYLSSTEGGLHGSISYGDMRNSVLRGYATASTDTGHSAADANWMINHPERVIDAGYRGKHLQTVAAKATIKAFYGQAPEKSYMAGCSGGGRQSLMELQRYPDDYDGYVIGAPANNWTGQSTYWALMNQAFNDPASKIPDAKIPAIKAATLAQCDAIDGVTDGIISDPRVCNFNADVLACPAGQDTNQCLTAPQLTALKKVLQGPRDSSGRQLFPPNQVGAETDNNNWSFFITSDAGPRNFLGRQVFGMLYNVPPANYDVMSFDFDTDPKLLVAQLGGILDATNPDLRVQKSKGIKVLHYHGWQDAALSPPESINYYEKVIASMGGLAQTQDFYKLYMVPGMVHCSGGPGPNHFGQPHVSNVPAATAREDIIKALEEWVEKGQAPDTIIATKHTNDDPTRPALLRRPLCPYPKVQKYIGGDPAAASSFACQ